MDSYHDYIVKSLSAGTSRMDVYRSLIAKGYQGKQTAAYDYMNRLIAHYQIEIAVYSSTSADAIERKKSIEKYDYVTRAYLFKFLWMNAELPSEHKEYIFEKYPQFYELYSCVKEFRQIFETTRMPLLYMFIDKYKQSELKALSVFASGLEKDIEAVENAVSSSLSNGFVEGTISKLKMAKRVMYGRCSRNLLAAKLMYEPNSS